MGIAFELLTPGDGAAPRRGRLTFRHRRAADLAGPGVVETPAFMPVGTQATVKTLTPAEAASLGTQILLANTYHLFLRPGHERIRRLGGLHRFMAWPGPILTDSGGYQVFSLARLNRIREDVVEFQSHLDGSRHLMSPALATEVQLALGSDILMAFDTLTPYPAERPRATEDVIRTARWAATCAEVWRRTPVTEVGGFGAPASPSSPHGKEGGSPPVSGMSRSAGDSGRPVLPPDATAPSVSSLFGIVQGSVYPDLRRDSAERLVDLDLPGYAIGGLAVGEPMDLCMEILEQTTPLLPEGRPRYLMGVGRPEDILEAVDRGVDLFDCVLPTRNARKGTVFTSRGRLVVKNAAYADDPRPIDPECDCPVCGTYSRAYLRHLFASGEILGLRLATLHSLRYYQRLMEQIRRAVEAGCFARFKRETLAQLAAGWD